MILEVFGNGLFGQNDPTTNAAQLAALQQSRLDAVILWSVHVHANGDLFYNDTPLVTAGAFDPAMQYMAPYVADLRKRCQIWWGVGSWGASDFANIGALLATPDGRATLTRSFGALLEAVPASGVDFDMEEGYSAEMRATIVQFTLLLHQALGAGVTYCPYQSEGFWLDCLADVYAQNDQQQIVQRFNLQCYAGGAGNTTAAWWTQLRSFNRPLGVADVDSFIVPGNWVQSDDGGTKNSPADIEAFFAEPAIGADAGGGFLWNTSEIFASGSTCAAYADAMAGGLARAGGSSRRAT